MTSALAVLIAVAAKPKDLLLNLMPESDKEGNAISEDLERRKSIQQVNRSVSQLSRFANSAWFLTIAGSAIFIAAGFLLARAYQANNRTRTERIIQEIQNWIENNRASVPHSLRKRFEATSSFLGSFQRKKPVEKLAGHFKPKPFWSIFV